MGLATVHGATGTPASLVVTIPPGDSSSGASGTPTGQISNGTTSFALAPGFPAHFIFVTEDGTISGWNSGVKATSAVIMVNTKSASVFKGVAVATVSDPTMGTLNFLYVADFRKGRIRVYDANFQPIRMDDDDAFRDERIPRGFAPFNVQNIGGNLYVTFAKQDSEKHDALCANISETDRTTMRSETSESPEVLLLSTSRTSVETSTLPLPSRTAKSTMPSVPTSVRQIGRRCVQRRANPQRFCSFQRPEHRWKPLRYLCQAGQRKARCPLCQHQ